MQRAFATHAMGADLSYRCLGNNQYEVTLRFYRDCTGVSAPSTISINALNTCNGQTITATLNPVGTAFALEVTPLCPPLRNCSECNNNPPANCPSPLYPGVEVYTYKGVLTLNGACANWQVSYSLCCRNNSITNLQTPGSQDMYLSVLINNLNGLCNNSPDFTELPTPYICRDQPYSYNHGVIEPDGDSLYYELINPMTFGGSPIPFVNPYSVANPLSTLTGFQFNQTNGQINLVPNQVQNAVTVIRVSEYRNGLLVGQTIRDIQVVVIDCPNNQIVPQLSPYRNPGGGGYIIDSFKMGVCPGNLITFDIVGTDGNALDSLVMTSNFDTVFTGGTWSATGVNPATASFSWTPTAADIGRHFFVVTVKDNNCPVTAQQTIAYEINVLNEVSAGPDKKFCTVGGPVELTAKGGSIFSWQPRSSIVGAAPDSSWILVQPTVTTTYTVSSDCNRVDSVTVEVVPSFTYNLSGNDTICRFDTTQLIFTPDPAFGPFDISWSPNYKLDTNGVASVIATPFYTTQYTLTALSKDGCELKDTVSVVIAGEAPRVNLFVDKIALCRDTTDKVQVEMFSSPSLCGISPTGCNGNERLVRIGEETLFTNIPTPYQGLYKFSRMQIMVSREELNQLGIFGGTISEISFEVANKLSTRPYLDYTIRMACVDQENIGNVFEENLTVVYGPATVNTTSGWNTYQLTNAYDWDGFTNLIIDICFSNPVVGGPNSDFVFYSPTSKPTTLFRLSNSSGPGCDLLIPLPSNRRPNLRFGICSQPTTGYQITWNPSLGLNDPTSPNPVIAGLTSTTKYNIVINNNGCISERNMTIFVDSTELILSPDTLLCDTTAVLLTVAATGIAPDLALNCGLNNTLTLYASDSIWKDDGDLAVKSSMFQGNVTDMRYQALYLASDLRAAGMKTGIITGLGFQLGAKNTIRGVDNFTIKMACTQVGTLTRNNFEPGTTTVYATPQYNSQSGWNYFTLDNTFDWDGVSNLIVEFCWDNPDNVFIGSIDEVYVANVSYDGVIRGYGVNTVGCDIATPNVAYKEVPNMMFAVVPPPPGAFEYTWVELGNSNPPVMGDSLLVTPKATTSYQVSTTSKFGCTIYDTVTVEVDILSTTVSADTAICVGEGLFLQASGGTTYRWEPAIPSLSDPDKAITAAVPDQTTLYTVTITDTASGCVIDRFVEVTVNPLPPADAGDTITILIGATTVLNGSGGTQYQWSPNYRLSDPGSPNPVAGPLQQTTYTLLVTDDNGCVTTDTVTIFVISIDDVYIPSAFSPNGDGVNDVYFITPLGLTEIDIFQIMNRWGQIVFNAGSLTDGWDGTINGVPQPLGTYIYYLQGSDYKGDPIIRQGNITLIR